MVIDEVRMLLLALVFFLRCLDDESSIADCCKTDSFKSQTFKKAYAEAEAAKPAWFHSAQFPQAQFKSTAVKGMGPGRYEVTGTLSIKGQSRDVVVPVLMVPGPTVGQAVASGSFTLRRMDFKLGEGEWSDLSVVANDVQVRFKLQLTGLLSP